MGQLRSKKNRKPEKAYRPVEVNFICGECTCERKLQHELSVQSGGDESVCNNRCASEWLGKSFAATSVRNTG